MYLCSCVSKTDESSPALSLELPSVVRWRGVSCLLRECWLYLWPTLHLGPVVSLPLCHRHAIMLVGVKNPVQRVSVVCSLVTPVGTARAMVLNFFQREPTAVHTSVLLCRCGFHLEGDAYAPILFLLTGFHHLAT